MDTDEYMEKAGAFTGILAGFFADGLFAVGSHCADKVSRMAEDMQRERAEEAARDLARARVRQGIGALVEAVEKKERDRKLAMEAQSVIDKYFPK